MKRDDEAWTLPEAALFAFLESGPEGLTSEEAAKRRAANGANILRESGNRRNADLLLSQFASPITLLLLAAVALSFFLGDIQDAAIILTIVLAGAALGFFQHMLQFFLHAFQCARYVGNSNIFQIFFRIINNCFQIYYNI